MKEFHLKGDSIEAKKCRCITRKLNVGAFVKIEKIGTLLSFKGSLNSEAEILEELAPKKYKHKKSSKLDQGSKLKSKDIYFLSSVKRKPSQKIINKSGRHKAQSYVFDKYTYAEISTPLVNILNSIEQRKKLKR